MDWKVVKFMTSYRYAISEKNMSLAQKTAFIKGRIDQGSKIEMIYLKRSDEKSKRVIQPKYVGELEYNGKSFTGIEAYCFKRKEMRRFRVDRILEMHEVS